MGTCGHRSAQILHWPPTVITLELEMLTDEFRKAKSATIEYEGKTVVLYDTLNVPEQGKIILRFLEMTSEWRQGVFIGHMRVGTDLRLTVSGQTAPGMKLWQDTSPESVEIAFSAPQGIINVYNIWDVGNGQSASQVKGAGMHVEMSEDGGTRIYRCNDGHEATTFNNLVFSLELA